MKTSTSASGMPARASPMLRPRSLAEVERLANGGSNEGSFDALLREFLDEFYLEDSSVARVQMLEVEPRITGNDRRDAYLAAVAEHLSRRYTLASPAWVAGPARFLKRPFFPIGLESLKAILRVEVVAGAISGKD